MVTGTVNTQMITEQKFHCTVNFWDGFELYIDMNTVYENPQ